jgi:3-hydroxybutyrate dehydrogenase
MATGSLTGRIAYVSAGSRGIGRGIVEGLLAEGASVALTGRSEDKGAKALAEIGAGDRAAFFACDARDQQSVEGSIDRTVEHFGKLDILVNNAGGSDGFAVVHEMTDEAWNNALTFILNSAFWATRRVLPTMVDNGWGRIINISSVEGKQGNKATVSHYITAKHALNGFTKAVGFEYGAKGITSNAICPGAIETDLMLEAGPAYAEKLGMTYEGYKEQYAAESANKRLNTVEEVAAMAVLLASPLGGGINCSLLNVDGGTSQY